MPKDRSAARAPRTGVVLDPMSESALARLARRAGRHVFWARTQGLGRMIEEDELNPLARVDLAVRRRRWQHGHPIPPGTATPVFLVGLQRSGTNMLARSLAASLEFEIHNENDRRAFERFRLRPHEVVKSIVEASTSRYALFKPLCDSHRTAGLLDGLGTASPGRAIWMCRGVDGRLRSAVAKFGDVNRVVLSQIAAGNASDTWQAQGISPDNMSFLRQFDYDKMTAESAAGLFWYIRHSLFFDLGLRDRSDVTLVSWDRLVGEPERYMKSLCQFLDLPYQASLIAEIAPRGDMAGRRVEIDPAIRARCDELDERLTTVAERASPAGL